MNNKELEKSIKILLDTKYVPNWLKEIYDHSCFDNLDLDKLLNIENEILDDLKKFEKELSSNYSDNDLKILIEFLKVVNDNNMVGHKEFHKFVREGYGTQELMNNITLNYIHIEYLGMYWDKLSMYFNMLL